MSIYRLLSSIIVYYRTPNRALAFYLLSYKLNHFTNVQVGEMYVTLKKNDIYLSLLFILFNLKLKGLHYGKVLV